MNSKTDNRTSFFLGHCLIWGIIGCGGDAQFPLVRVTGTVTLDGEPVPDANVIFSPGPTASRHNIAFARTDEEGRFTLQTDGRAGAAATDYEVTVSALDDVGDDRIEVGPSLVFGGKRQPGTRIPAAIGRSRVPMKYAIPSESGLSFTVGTDGGHFDVALKSDPVK